MYSSTLSLTPALEVVGGQRHAPAACPRERHGTHCIGGCVGPGSVWTGAESLTPTGIRSPDRPGRSESLYRLSYPGPHRIVDESEIFCSMMAGQYLPTNRRIAASSSSRSSSPRTLPKLWTHKTRTHNITDRLTAHVMQ
jgi:hypothetical protein